MAREFLNIISAGTSTRPVLLNPYNLQCWQADVGARDAVNAAMNQLASLQAAARSQQHQT